MTTTDHEDRCASRGCKVTLTGRGYITDRDGSGVPMPLSYMRNPNTGQGRQKLSGFRGGTWVDRC
jgi:hypothetical protein